MSGCVLQIQDGRRSLWSLSGGLLAILMLCGRPEAAGNPISFPGKLESLLLRPAC